MHLALISTLMWMLFIYFSACTLYFFVIAVASAITPDRHSLQRPLKRKVAILIPAYKEDGIILNTVVAATSHDYPQTHYDVIVIADHMRESTLAQIRAKGAQVIEVRTTRSSKARALNLALNTLEAQCYHIAMILDADNIMAPQCLEKVNSSFAQGAQAVQCHRVAKNTDTPVALLEAVNEEINNTLFRRGQRALGLNACSAGSGMAFDFTLIKEIFNIERILDDTGEDREVDLQLLCRGIHLEYLEDAHVYDEKAADITTFKNQRLRWYEAHMNHITRFFDRDLRRAKKTNIFLIRLSIT